MEEDEEEEKACYWLWGVEESFHGRWERNPMKRVSSEMVEIERERWEFQGKERFQNREKEREIFSVFSASFLWIPSLVFIIDEN